MNIENIDVGGITDIEGVRRVIEKLVDCIFEMNREIKRELGNLTSQNVKSLDFNITRVENADRVFPDNAKEEE